MTKTHLLIILIYALYAVALYLCPFIAVYSLFLVPIVVTAIVGHLYGFRMALFAIATGAISVIIPLDVELYRFVPFLIITAVLTYMQYLKDSIKVKDRDLRFFEDQLHYINASVDDVIVTTTNDTKIRYISKSVEKMFGYKDSELIGQDIFVIYAPKVREVYKNYFTEYIKTRKKLLDWSGTETTCQKSDGTFFPAEIKIWEFQQDGESYFTIIVNDITERKRAENELKASNDRYEAFIKNSTEGIWRFELRKPCPISLSPEAQVDWFYEYGYLAECNDAMAQMYGYDNAGIILGKPLEFLLPNNGVSRMYLIALIMENYLVHDLESTEKSESGEIVYFSNSMVGIVENGYLVRGWGVQRDITATKQYTLEREGLLQEMQKAKAAAEIANKEKDKFLANLSHELRTPLVAILGYSNLYNEETPKEDLLKGMSVINKNAKIQLDMIEDLLDVSKVMADKIKLSKTKFDLNAVILDSIDSVKPKADEKGIKIIYNPLEIEVLADKKRIHQVINNLLSNAVRFTNKGQVEIKTWQDESNFYIEVLDTGVGIRESEIFNIWKPFVQTGDNKQHVGVGLGLSIVKNLVELHHGFVEVNSQVGVGSSFIVMIPNDVESLNWFGINVLLAEDSIDNGELISTYLKLNGANVFWARDAHQVYEVLKTKKFDVYLFDIALPDEDGITITEKLLDRGDFTPKVAISAYVNYREKALDSGFDMFIEKPIDWEKLLSVKNLIKGIDKG